MRLVIQNQHKELQDLQKKLGATGRVKEGRGIKSKILQHVAHLKFGSISIFLGLNVIKSSFIENASAKGKKA